MNQELRDQVFKAIARACKKWPDIVWDGTTVDDIRAMLGAARKHLNNSFEWEQPFGHQKFASFDYFSRELKWRIEGDDAFAIVGISKPWSHWTCAHRLTGLHGDGTDYEFDHRQTFTLMKTKG